MVKLTKKNKQLIEKWVGFGLMDGYESSITLANAYEILLPLVMELPKSKESKLLETDIFPLVFRIFRERDDNDFNLKKIKIEIDNISDLFFEMYNIRETLSGYSNLDLDCEYVAIVADEYNKRLKRNENNE